MATTALFRGPITGTGRLVGSETRAPSYYTAGNWWERPGLSTRAGQDPRPGTPLRWNDLRLPEWAGDYGDPASFYAAYQATPEPFRPQFTATLRSTWDQKQRAEAGRQAALDEISGAEGNLDAWQRNFETDPRQAEVERMWRERASRNFSIVSPLEERAFQNTISQNYARARADASVRAGARGGGGGGETGRDAALLSMADAAGLQLRGQIAGANSEARERAIGHLGDISDRRTAIGFSVEQLRSDLARNRAQIQQSLDYVPTDYMAFSQLNLGWDAYNRMLDQMSDDERRYEEATRIGLVDIVNLAINAIGSGLPGMLMGG